MRKMRTMSLLLLLLLLVDLQASELVNPSQRPVKPAAAQISSSSSRSNSSSSLVSSSSSGSSSVVGQPMSPTMVQLHHKLHVRAEMSPANLFLIRLLLFLLEGPDGNVTVQSSLETPLVKSRHLKVPILLLLRIQ